MRLVDARNHRQGNGDQRPRLTASRRCVQDGDREQTAPTSLLCGMSAAERGRNEKRGAVQRENAPYLIKLLFCTPRRGVPLPLAMPGTCPCLWQALRAARRTLHT